MIATFGCKQTQAIFERRKAKLLAGPLQRIAHRKLLMLHLAVNLLDLRSPPANRLESLKGDRAGQYSIRINDPWRICFHWAQGAAYDVQIVDYH